ncbi:RND transporter [Flavobacterium akiainvivens]|uniref:RND transporter n=1 Tax=Flavobacterium akiainvivens TaxID=1202724 RepID=A0A0M8MGB0_9FLAO|nr:TolC family protein [Flavobacterium akiainvivens]KOS05661.1 RND transporter [Flavobacterium akiainvivens]SFQ36222.1 efflux transporter, outer membrane factor (OMF) lipoprotein, NodT family [Flavobacterium akiainvivens]
MKATYYIAFALTTISLSSCVVGKKYQREELNAPAAFREDFRLTGDSIAMPWKEFYKDTKLQELIDKALTKNFEVATALKTMEQLDLNYKQAKLSILPSLDLNVSANRQYLSKTSLNGSLSEQFTGQEYLDDYNASLSLSWEADVWGKAALRKRDTRAAYFAQKENLQALKTRIIVQVAQAYYNLLGLDEQLKIAEKNIELTDSTLKMMRLQYNSGTISSLALDQTEAQKKTAELLLPQAKASIAVQENALQILCGAFPDRVERAGSLDSNTIEAKFPAGVPASLLSRRPDVKASEYLVMSAAAKAGLAKAAMYPSLTLTPSVGANTFEFEKWFDFPGSITKTIAAGLVQPLFRKKELSTAYKVAQIEQEKAVIAFKQSYTTAVGEVSDAMSKLKYAQERQGLVVQKTASLDKAVKDANLLYGNGMADYLEVITAQNSALQNDLEAINIKLEQVNAMIELYRALGGGVD